MPSSLDKDDISERLNSYSYNNYLHIGGIIKGVAIGVATLVGLRIFSDLEHWPRIPLWIASFLSILISYMTWGRGALLTNSRSNLWDSILPLVMGLFEFALFGVLLPNKESPQIWRHWFLILFFHTFLAVLLITNRIKNTIIEEDFDLSLQKLANKYMGWMYRDRKGASGIAIASIIIWFILNWYVFDNDKIPEPYPGRIYAILAMIMCGFLCIPIYEADKQRRSIDDLLLEQTKTDTNQE